MLLILLLSLLARSGCASDAIIDVASNNTLLITPPAGGAVLINGNDIIATLSTCTFQVSQLEAATSARAALISAQHSTIAMQAANLSTLTLLANSLAAARKNSLNNTGYMSLSSCAYYHTCNACISDPKCGWCAADNTCFLGSLTGANATSHTGVPATCVTGDLQYWFWIACPPVSTTPAPTMTTPPSVVPDSTAATSTTAMPLQCMK